MSSSKVEQARLLHQDLEQNSKRCVDDMLKSARNTRERINKEHRIAKRIKFAARTGKALLSLYEDASGARKKELEEISGDNVFEVFYDRLKDVRHYHRKNPQAAAAQAKMDGGSSVDVKVDATFTGEEHGGRFVDLHAFHDRFLNMKVFSQGSDHRPTYIEYLSLFDKFTHIPKHKKLHGRLATEYQTYLGDLLAYLVDFFKRTQPLVETKGIDDMIEADFKQRWGNKQVSEWFVIKATPGEDGKTAVADASNPLFCAPCERLFAKPSVFNGHLKGRKHKRNAAKHAAKHTGTQTATFDENFPVALTEERVVQYAGLVRDTVNDTLVYLQNKQTRTYNEITADLEEEIDPEDLLSDSDAEEDVVISNPLNLPLGWDGKPIPFWLYKLHGLNIEYKCEICGNYTYRGPRAFRRHFREWRHAYGMRCLGIPNTDHFFNITTFKDAIALHKKLINQMKAKDFRAEEEEEFEDDEGHVFNKKTYEDLRRQGLI